MKKVRVAFYKNPFGSWTDFAIASWTWLFNPFTKPYSHVEIGFKISGKWRYFSSSIRDGGTRWIDSKDLLKNRERWDIFECEYREEAVIRMIERANSIKDKKYDVLGILGFVTLTGQVFNSKDRWYCSEACWLVLSSLWKKRISPRRMSSRVRSIFKEVI